MAHVFNMFGPSSGEAGDIPPPGIEIKKYRVSIVSGTVWREIECELANGSKLILTFLDENSFNQLKEDHYSHAQSFVFEKDYGFRYRVYFENEVYEQILDLMRNEKPLYFVFITNDCCTSIKPKYGFILTEPEPVGAEESLELSIQGLIIYSKGNLIFNVTPVVNEYLKEAGIVQNEAATIITKLSDLSQTKMNPDEVAKVLERTAKDPAFRTIFRKNPKEAVRKLKATR